MTPRIETPRFPFVFVSQALSLYAAGVKLALDDDLTLIIEFILKYWVCYCFKDLFFIS